MNASSAFVFSLLLAGAVSVSAATDIHVSPTGDDSNAGTAAAPLQTLSAAQKAVRLAKAQGLPDGGITVYLHGGVYRLQQPLVLGPDDSGAAGRPITWKAASGEKAVISGATPVTGWEEHGNGIWKAKLNRTEKLRQFFVNDVPATMAAHKGALIPTGWYGKFAVTGTEPWAVGPGESHEGMRFKTAGFPHVARPQDLELQQRRTWTVHRLNVQSIGEKGDETLLAFQQPFGAIGERLGWGCGLSVKQFKECYLYNALEFLTQPGEFYFDRDAGTLYYMPRPGEDMKTARAEVPVTVRLLQVQGENLEKRAHDLCFEGLTFAHTGWQMMKVGDSFGVITYQSGSMTVMFKNDGNWHDEPWGKYDTQDVPPGAVEAVNAANLAFRRNTFTCLGAVALNLENDVQNAEVVGNVFQWVEGGGVSIGHPQHVYIGKQNGDNEGYGPYNIDNSHDKYDETHEGLAKQVTVANNVFRNTCWVWWDMSPIAMYYGHSVHILHNDLLEIPYIGITCGWGWFEFNGLRDAEKFTKIGRESGGFPSLSTRDLKVNYNRVVFPYTKLNDAGALYFLGDCATPAKNIMAQSDFSEVRGNYLVERVPVADGQLIYTDEGASFLRFEENV